MAVNNATTTTATSGVSGGMASFEEKEAIESSSDSALFEPSSVPPPAWIAKDAARVHASLTREQQALATKTIKEAISKIVSGYFDIIRSFLDYPVSFFTVCAQHNWQVDTEM